MNKWNYMIFSVRNHQHDQLIKAMENHTKSVTQHRPKEWNTRGVCGIYCIWFFRWPFPTVSPLPSFIQGWSGLDDRRRGSAFSHRWYLMYDNLTMLNLQNSSNWTGPNNWYHPADTIPPQHGTSTWTLLSDIFIY